jgi:uridine kinase
MTRSNLLREIGTRILGINLTHPTRVAIDGVDAAGKTTLANELAIELGRSGRHVIRASVDGFHNPKVIRRQDDSAEGYFRCSFNYPSLVSNLLEPLGPNGSRQFCRAVFDFRSDSAVASEVEQAVQNSILLFDGVFLLRRELRSYWDLSIFVDATFETVLARAEARDRELFGSVTAVQERYGSRYIPGQRMYLEQEQPRQVASIIVINDNLDNPGLERAA